MYCYVQACVVPFVIMVHLQNDLTEQHLCIKVYYKLGKNSTETFRVFQVVLEITKW